jgi:hypothetical protein
MSRELAIDPGFHSRIDFSGTNRFRIGRCRRLTGDSYERRCHGWNSFFALTKDGCAPAVRTVPSSPMPSFCVLLLATLINDTEEIVQCRIGYLHETLCYIRWLSLFHVSEQSASLFACVVISNSAPCTLFELAKYSIGLVYNADHLGNDFRLVGLAARPRVSSYEPASKFAEVLVSHMVVAVFASTANYREAGWLKVSPELRSSSFG